MTTYTHPQRKLTALCVAAALGLMAATAHADPSSRVARLSYADGAVSFSPAGDNSWLQAPLNRPLVSGDRVWADSGARDELQVGSATVRMDSGSLVTLLNVSDNTTQLQLSQGRVVLRVGQLGPNEVMEVDTPNLAFSIRRPGHYRIDVDAAGNSTAVTVGEGQGQAYGEGNTYLIDAGQSYRFGGTDLHNYAATGVGAPDDFDRWANARDRRQSHSQAVRYVSPDVVGYQDLDDAGSWHTVPEYGPVWTPSHVASNWAPYHDGHWTWVDPYGWTWVDDQPWGFAVTHYGRWANIQGNWGWVPGPVHERPVYAPALVAFVGGAALMLSERPGSNGVAWFPLAPREVYRPAYHVSQNYFTNINASNTVINRTQITNVYNNNVTNITYVNRDVRGAVTAVPTATFVHAQPVGRAAIALSPQMLAHAQVAGGAAIAPQRESLGEQREGHRPADAMLARPAIVRTAPPAPPVAFAARQSALAANGGRPLDAEAMARLHGAPAQAAPQFHMVHVAANAPAGHPPMQQAPGQGPAPMMAAGGRPGNGGAMPQAPGRPGAMQQQPMQQQQQMQQHMQEMQQHQHPEPANAALANQPQGQHPNGDHRPPAAMPPHQLDQQTAQQAQAAHRDDAMHHDQAGPRGDAAHRDQLQQQAQQHQLVAVAPPPNHAPAAPQPQAQHNGPPAQAEHQAEMAHMQQQHQAEQQAQQQRQAQQQQQQQHQAQQQQQHQAQEHAQHAQEQAQAHEQHEQHAPPAAQPQQEHHQPPQQMAQAKPQPPHPHEGGGEHHKEEEKH